MQELSIPVAQLRALIPRLLTRFGDSIEFWTVACLSQRELGDPKPFLNEQWDILWETIQELRAELASRNSSAHPALHEQVAKLCKTASDLRDIFEVLAEYTTVAVPVLESSLLKLNNLWGEWRNRVALVAALLPLSSPLPTLNSDQEGFYQDALDGLFDRFYSARQMHSPSDIRPR